MLNNKKSLFFALLPVLFLFLFAGSSNSQTMKDFTWDTYHVKFQIPTTFNVDKNTSDAFGAGDPDAYLSIYPRQGESMSFSGMKGALETWALDSKVYDYPKVNELDNLNGYWGVYVDGTNSENKLPATLLILVHPDYPKTKLYVWINYKSDAFDMALKMLKSFTPTY